LPFGLLNAVGEGAHLTLNLPNELSEFLPTCLSHFSSTPAVSRAADSNYLDRVPDPSRVCLDCVCQRPHSCEHPFVYVWETTCPIYAAQEGQEWVGNPLAAANGHKGEIDCCSVRHALWVKLKKAKLRSHGQAQQGTSQRGLNGCLILKALRHGLADLQLWLENALPQYLSQDAHCLVGAQLIQRHPLLSSLYPVTTDIIDDTCEAQANSHGAGQAHDRVGLQQL
jgi:hypothetical protein